MYICIYVYMYICIYIYIYIYISNCPAGNLRHRAWWKHPNPIANPTKMQPKICEFGSPNGSNKWSKIDQKSIKNPSKILHNTSTYSFMHRQMGQIEQTSQTHAICVQCLQSRHHDLPCIPTPQQLRSFRFHQAGSRMRPSLPTPGTSLVNLLSSLLDVMAGATAS